MATPEKLLSYKYTPEEYLALERASDTKHEYLDGEIRMMAGGSPTHNQICFNTTVHLGVQIANSSCIGYTSDQKIRTDPMDLFTYPDLTIVCGEPVFHDENQDVILNPTVLIEVLSPRTENYDRSTKLVRYQNIRSLSDYILISQNRPCIEHYARQKGKAQWLLTIETDLEAEIEIASLHATLTLAEVYHRVTFPAAKAALIAVDTQPPATSRKPRRRKTR